MNTVAVSIKTGGLLRHCIKAGRNLCHKESHCCRKLGTANAHVADSDEEKRALRAQVVFAKSWLFAHDLWETKLQDEERDLCCVFLFFCAGTL